MSKTLIAFSPVTGKDNKTYWTKMGVAFANRDGSINVFLDGLPVNGRLQIREQEPRGDEHEPERTDKSGRGQAR